MNFAGLDLMSFLRSSLGSFLDLIVLLRVDNLNLRNIIFDKVQIKE
jgi:hypothetical protein